MPRSSLSQVYVTEAEEQALRPFVQDIFFAMMDRQRAVHGTVDREASVAFAAQGLGQALAANSLGDDAARWERAFFDHLAEVGIKVSASRAKPSAGVAPFIPALVSAFRKDEEWFFPKTPVVRLKIWLTACFRLAERVRPEVKPARAAAIFLEHFRDGVARPVTVSRPKKARVVAKPRRRA